MMMRRWRRRGDAARAQDGEPALAARRAHHLLEATADAAVVLDSAGRVVAASRQARAALRGLEVGEPLPDALRGAAAHPAAVSYEVDGRRETILVFPYEREARAYAQLRTEFTAAVSHELRTPVARLLALLETAMLPGGEPREAIERAHGEVEQIRELIDDALFLGELETGREVAGLLPHPARPVLEEVVGRLREPAARAGIQLRLEGDEVALPLRPRMIRIVAENLVQNGIRYAGRGAVLTLALEHHGDEVALVAADTGAGVPPPELRRLFERFFRGSRARASRGTGLGLAIVKHVVGAAEGQVAATETPGGGLTVRCAFPAVQRRSPPFHQPFTDA